MADNDATPDIERLLAEARARQQLISANLPEGVDPRSLTWASKIPYNVMCYREAQFVRAEEFARAACDMFERNDVVVGISNTRALVESVAAIWFLNEKVERQISGGLDHDLHAQVVALLMGFKNDEAFPKAVNVLTMIDKCDAVISGFRAQYDRMSEFAHPNYSGALGVYGERDADVAITWFRKGGLRREMAKGLGLSLLVPSMELLEYAYNRTADLMPEFCKMFGENPS